MEETCKHEDAIMKMVNGKQYLEARSENIQSSCSWELKSEVN